jgi:hypothetical protein
MPNFKMNYSLLSQKYLIIFLKERKRKQKDEYRFSEAVHHEIRTGHSPPVEQIKCFSLI